MGSQAQPKPQCPGRSAGTQPGRGCAQQSGKHQQSRRLGASVPQLCLMLLLHSSLLLGYSSSHTPAAKLRLKQRFGEEEEVADPLAALRAMTVTLTG